MDFIEQLNDKYGDFIRSIPDGLLINLVACVVWFVFYLAFTNVRNWFIYVLMMITISASTFLLSKAFTLIFGFSLPIILFWISSWIMLFIITEKYKSTFKFLDDKKDISVKKNADTSSPLELLTAHLESLKEPLKPYEAKQLRSTYNTRECHVHLKKYIEEQRRKGIIKW